MLAWAAAYLVVALVAMVLVLARREPTIVRGDWVFLLTSAFVLLAASVTALRGERLSLGALMSPRRSTARYAIRRTPRNTTPSTATTTAR